MSTFLVMRRQAGPQWNPALSLREQTGFAEHARYMDALVEQGVVILGGPLPDRRVALAVEAESLKKVQTVLADDPWTGSHLVDDRIEPWTILLDTRPPAASQRPA
jgi:uncharacterized protein YciI